MEDKMLTVVFVVLTIFGGLIVYMIYQDIRLKKMEKRVNEFLEDTNNKDKL